MADTIQSDIETALFSHLETLVTSPVTDIAYPNVKFKPGTKPYLQVLMFPAETNTHLLGATAPKVYLGHIQITVISKIGKGTAESAKIAGQVVDHFKMGTRVTEGTLRAHVPRQPSINPSFTQKEAFYTPVRIPYFSSN